jgi:hypothetical protein
MTFLLFKLEHADSEPRTPHIHGNAAREEVRKELLSLLDEMQRNVAASGVSERELDLAIDETVSNVRASNQ